MFRELLVSFGVNAIVSWAIATLVFLIGAEIGVASIASAVAAGIIGGVVNATTYQIGKMKCGGTFDFKTFGVQVLAAVLLGSLGGLQMGL